MTGETAWLIERGGSEPSAPTYWAGLDRWSQDHMDAVRFARKVDAERVSARMRWPNNRVCEHIWTDGKAMAAEAANQRVAELERERDRLAQDFKNQTDACGKWIAKCKAAEACYAAAKRERNELKRERDAAIYELTRYHEVRAKAPDWEKLWAEQTEAREASERKERDLRAQSAILTYLLEQCAHSDGGSSASEPSPAEHHIEWHWQQISPGVPSLFDQLHDDAKLFFERYVNEMDPGDEPTEWDRACIAHAAALASGEAQAKGDGTGGGDA